jgi:hypothetical protein
VKHSALSGSGARVARVLYRWLKRLVLAATFVQLCIYAYDVHTRWTKHDTCDWSPVKDRYREPHPRPPYVARYCYVGRDEVWLQVYDASGRDLLAERMYFDPDKGSFFWYTDPRGGPNYLMYQSSSSDSGYGEIAIPPTRLDRLLAALP